MSLDETDKENRRYQDPENQLKPLREFCHSMDYTIYNEFVDHESGANPNRPMFRKMLHEAFLRRFQGILVWKLDRFSREGILNTLSYIKRLKQRGIWLRSFTESWLDTTQDGITDIVIAVLSFAASEERRHISERTKAGIAQRRAIGQWKGGRPKKCKKCGNIFPRQLNGCPYCGKKGSSETI